MMDDFVIDEQKLKQLADRFNIEEDICKTLFKLYEDSVSKNIKAQYLAHIIRSLELSMRKMTGNELFVIKCVPMPKKNIIQNVQGRYNEGLCFIIYFNEDLLEYEKRSAVAHELGHLFMVALANEHFKRNPQLSEPLASLFGIFAIASKNQFYQNDALTYAKNIDAQGWDGFLDDFLPK